MAENEALEAQKSESSDIFEWFSSDESLLQDVDEFEKNTKKDIYDHANTLWNVFKICNIVLLVLCICIGVYIHVQQDNTLSNSSVLDPFCKILVWDVPTKQPHCSSIASLSESIKADLIDMKSQQFSAIAYLIEPLYLATDFINSSEVLFLLDKTQDRLKPLAILEEFDRLKNTFESADKSAVNCYNIEIQENRMSARCDAYSSDWDRTITLPDGTTQWKIWGTSISIASSFLDFIESNSSDLRVIDKPKYFSAESVSWENGWYTKKTTFFLQIEYINDNLAL